jgi:hypothetical protein
VMLHSTFDPALSLTAHAGAVAGRGLSLAIVWWPVAMVLSIGYCIFVFRQFDGKVRLSPTSSH